MHQYAILYHPGHNRVYYEESKRFCLYELEAICQKAALTVQEAQLTRIGGVDYITFACPEPLEERSIQDLFHLSFCMRFLSGWTKGCCAPCMHRISIRWIPVSAAC